MRVFCPRLFILTALYGTHGAAALLDQQEPVQHRLLRTQQSGAADAPLHGPPPIQDGETDEEERSELGRLIKLGCVEFKALFISRKFPDDIETTAEMDQLEAKNKIEENAREEKHAQYMASDQYKKDLINEVERYRRDPKLAEANLQEMARKEKVAQEQAADRNQPSRRGILLAPFKKLAARKKEKKRQEEEKLYNEMTAKLNRETSSLRAEGVTVEKLREMLRVPPMHDFKYRTVAQPFFASSRGAERYTKVRQYIEYLETHPLLPQPSDQHQVAARVHPS
uniref:RxLR effector candidate protein n=3 Tax=Hyaloperonospora arabidopsidis (strain Emoy2) TaxID=559515 RepID=M4BVX2_HYAAE